MSVTLKQTQLSWPTQSDADKPRGNTRGRLQLIAATLHHLRDGEVVLYRRGHSQVWQCRCKLVSGKWLRFSTKQRNLTDAAPRACQVYDETRFRERLGLAPQSRRFREIADATLAQLRAELASGSGKSIYRDYCAAIERYFIPFLGNRFFDRIDHGVMLEFERWRNAQLKRAPAKSTLLTYAAAWQRLQQTALERGWITQVTAVPKLSVQGRKSEARPAFSAEEVVALREFMASWCAARTRRPIESEMRLLLRDYVELLLLTGIRHGTEAMRLEWRHSEWYWDGSGVKYLRILVSGKTGARWLIAKHGAVGVLERRAAADVECQNLSLDDVLSRRLPLKLFRFQSGQQPHNFNAVFRRLLMAAGLLQDRLGQVRTLYSLRHTYATAELLVGTDIHTLARQMGTSVVMLERHYSKLTATLAAGQLAGG